ncbi:MAG: hypothetical protein A2X46_06570 [Lentisphaerae bacterium GWF2_57_35]|nr:MAG: hypothetical protein A2X46_06570 [Lentisphaerae bacterium GWF2_57_35]
MVKWIAAFVLLVGFEMVHADEAFESPAMPEPSITADPNNPDVKPESPVNGLFEAANRDMAATNWPAAITKLEQVIEQDPSLLSAWGQLGWCYWNNGRQDKAIELWETLRRINPKLPMAYNLLGMAYMANGEQPKAIEFFRKSLELDPDQEPVEYSIARLSRWEGRFEDSISILRRQLDKNEDRLDIRLELARAYLNNWQFEEALPLWEKLAQSQPDNLEYRLYCAECRLRTGQADEALPEIEQILAEDPNHTSALLIMADRAEYGERPADAIPYLRRLVAETTELQLRQKYRMRLIDLYVRLNRDKPLEYPLNEAIGILKDYIRDDPNNTDALLLLGELLSMDNQFADAQQKFTIVLRDFNPNNMRAQRGLFEAYAAEKNFAEADKHLKRVEAFNPQDPYNHYLRARYEAARGRFGRAYQELDKLEAAGQQGSVLVLLFHGLTTSEWTEIPSVRLFREQLMALQKAGFRFLTPMDLRDYFSSLERINDSRSERTPNRAVIITFDDARLDSFRLATPVFKDLGIPFSMHVPVGNIERKDPFLASWKQLADYRQQGWVMGSHLYEASTPVPGERGMMVRPLTSLIRLNPANRMETLDEFNQRIHMEYDLSSRLMQSYLGEKPSFVAYPMGDIGQETYSDVPEAVTVNLQSASTNYAVGFIQSVFGYAVNGDNPLLYQRHELGRHVSASNTVNEVLRMHPVFLARRMRAELATLEGKQYKALKILERLKEDGYPEQSYNDLNTYVHTKLSHKFVPPPSVDNVSKGPFNLDIKKPYVGARAHYFQDNLERKNYHMYAFGGLNLTPNIVAEGQAGWGQLKQGRQDLDDGSSLPEIEVDETSAGVKGSFTFPSGNLLSGDFMLRNFGEPVNEVEPTYGIEGQFKPVLPLDLTGRFEHDVEPSARTVVRDMVTYDQWMANGVFSIRDWWDVWGSGQYYLYSDDNNRLHGAVSSQWLIWEDIGLRLGLRYAYTTSEEARDDYWTPYQLNRFYLEASLRHTYQRTYYNLQARTGLGKQNVRPDADEKHQARLVQLNQDIATARQQRWPQSDIDALIQERDQLIVNPPEEEWKPVFGLAASVRSKLGEHWELHGEVSVNKVPEYYEATVAGDITFRF